MQKRSVSPVILGVILFICGLFVWTALSSLGDKPAPGPDLLGQEAQAQSACSLMTKPEDVPAPILINFDDLPNAATIGDYYRHTFGVRFEDSRSTRAITYGLTPGDAASPPNFAINNALVGTSANVPMVISFTSPKTHVGFYLGNGDTPDLTALLQAFDAQGSLICEERFNPVPSPLTSFAGIYDPSGSIMTLTINYGNTTLSEAIDDLRFAPGPGVFPTRTPVPTWTPVPTSTPVPGPSPTPTSILPMYSFHPYVDPFIPNFTFILPDLSIHGMEITEGIQCYDMSQGDTTCADNSVPLVTQKDSVARIYLKFGGASGYMNNVPVRLHIRANNVWYEANTNGKATTTVNRGVHDGAEVYFNVNFTNNVVVDFYAEVDPNNVIAETNESNNRYPASGYLTLTYSKRRSLNIVGDRLRYHPSGYSDSQYAGGWAVNGGAADWYEQVLPIKNNGVNYSIASGYKNWTTSLGSGDGQHALIQSLNAQWILQNVFAWFFSGDLTGARHVYGFAPSAGYSGGHADMPIYPHAGGLGVVGIGSDAPGTSTDAPGSGALIFGHELTHDYNIYHTNTADGCGSNDSNSDFPYSSSSIQEFGFNPYTGKIYDPATTHDLMSYCPSGGSKQGWIAPFTWKRMFVDLSPVTVRRFGAPPTYNGIKVADDAETLVVDATIYNPFYTPPIPGEINALHKVGGGLVVPVPQGPYAIELHDINGDLLGSETFDVDFHSEYTAQPGLASPQDAPPFPPDATPLSNINFAMTWVDGTTSVVLTYEGSPIDTVQVSANPPQVLITAPTGAETWEAGSSHDLTWSGLDVDGDPLTYDVYYSYDGGLTWELLANGLTESHYTANADDFAGTTDARFRVVVSDGVLTALDETAEPITIPNKAPTAIVLHPVDQGIYRPGDLVVLQGSGNDLEDGTLPDDSLVWSSDVQGELGIGPSVPLTSLQTGEHHITLTVYDSFGISGETTVNVFIDNPLYLPAMQR
jgi:hypothetical protein